MVSKADGDTAGTIVRFYRKAKILQLPYQSRDAAPRYNTGTSYSRPSRAKSASGWSGRPTMRRGRGWYDSSHWHPAIL